MIHKKLQILFHVFPKKPQAGDRQGPRRMVSLSQICCWILAYPLPGRSLTFEGLWRSRTFQIPSKLRARALPMQNERPPGRRHIGRGNRSRSCSDGSPVNACVTANLLSEKSLVGPFIATVRHGKGSSRRNFATR